MKICDPKKQDLDCHITTVKTPAPGWLALDMHAPEIAAAAQPGMFVQVRARAREDPLLRRPFSIAGVSADKQNIQLLIRILGPATKIMAESKPGDTMRVLGPLGNSFEQPDEREIVWMVAGGCGLAPFIFAVSQWPAKNLMLFYGAALEKDCEPMALVPSGALAPEQIVLTTDDGSRGERGFVTDALTRRLDAAPQKPARILACGPAPMLKKVHQIATAANIPCEVSMEAYMGCGFGACMGCVIPATQQPFLHVCTHGPVFESSNIDWGKI